MTKKSKYLLAAIALVISSASTAFATSLPSQPVLFFTDIITGANSGGEIVAFNGTTFSGVYVTLYGENFGASPTVTLGSCSTAATPPTLRITQAPTTWLWYQKMVVQLSSSCTGTNNFQITTAGGSSNTQPFTVVAGHIYFVAPTGSDSASGSFGTPWASVAKAHGSSAAGDTIYFRAGTWNTQEQFGATLFCQNVGDCSGSASGGYRNFVGYPGELATWGGNQASRAAVDLYRDQTYVTFANLTFRSYNASQYGTVACMSGVGGCTFVRVVGSDFRALSAASAGLDFASTDDNVHVLGNTSSLNACASYEGGGRSYSMYFGGYGQQTNMEVGWNDFGNNGGGGTCGGKAIQLYCHTSGDTISADIHDNLIHDNTMAGMNLGGNDGGTECLRNVNVYNNLIYANNCCSYNTGHDEPGAIEILDAGTSANSVIKIYNNTFYNNNAPAAYGGSIGVDNSMHSVTVDNNIFSESVGSSACYIYYYSAASGFSYANNDYFGHGTTLACNTTITDATKMTSNPLFANTTTPDFHLQQTSPVIGAGTATLTTTYDHDGLLRPISPSIGPYEYTAGSGAGLPAPPTGLNATVN